MQWEVIPTIFTGITAILTSVTIDLSVQVEKHLEDWLMAGTAVLMQDLIFSSMVAELGLVVMTVGTSLVVLDL